MALKAGNGKYVCTKKNGQLSAVSDAVGKLPPVQNRVFSTEATSHLQAHVRGGGGGRLALFLSQVITSYS